MLKIRCDDDNDNDEEVNNYSHTNESSYFKTPGTEYKVPNA